MLLLLLSVLGFCFAGTPINKMNTFPTDLAYVVNLSIVLRIELKLREKGFCQSGHGSAMMVFMKAIMMAGIVQPDEE